jgi:hypothetical protein
LPDFLKAKAQVVLRDELKAQKFQQPLGSRFIIPHREDGALSKLHRLL